MSGKIKLNAASGGGSVSIQAPSSESNNRTLTLPSDADGTIVSKDTTNNLANIASINSGSIGTNNLVINGAFTVAQRSSDPVNDDSYRTVDRFQLLYGGTDNHPTQAQHALTSSDTAPYQKGFRFSYHITNGDQTSGAGTNDNLYIQTKLESQDLANSGWNYTSASSFITLSFWVKSSVAQNFYGYLRTMDGTGQRYAFETGSLSADTWTKVTKTIPGNSNLQFDNDANEGLQIIIAPFFGTAFTDSGVSLNAWGAYSSSARMPDNTSTWYTTNDATFEITGVQLEVGSTASAFAMETYGDTLRKCQRYLYILDMGSASNNHFLLLARFSHNNGVGYGDVQFPTTMRNNPSFSYLGTAITQSGYAGDPGLYASTPTMATLYGGTSTVANGITYLRRGSDSNAFLKLVFSAEL